MSEKLRAQTRTLQALKRDLAQERKRQRERRRLADKRRRERQAARQVTLQRLSHPAELLRPGWEQRAEAARRGRLTASYRHELGPAPVCEPGDHLLARAYVQRVERLIERGGWTRSECAGLHVLRARWRRRADGQDVRFNLVGNRPGRLPRTEEARITKARRDQ